MAPGLRRYQGLATKYREDMLKVTELEQFYKATCEDLERLRLNEKYVLDQSFEGRGDFNLNMSAQFISHKPLSSSPSAKNHHGINFIQIGLNTSHDQKD